MHVDVIVWMLVYECLYNSSTPSRKSESARTGHMHRSDVAGGTGAVGSRLHVCDVVFVSFPQAAAEICQVPAALITVLDHESTWFKSNLGFGDATHTQRNITLCDHVIRSNELLIIEDLTKDARFKDNPFVTAPPHMRFCQATATPSFVRTVRRVLSSFLCTVLLFVFFRCWRSAD